MSGEKDLYQMPSNDKVQWFVLHVKWRRENDFETLLKEAGVRSFIARRIELVGDPCKGKKERRVVNVIPEVVFVYASFDFLSNFLSAVRERHQWTIYFGKMYEGGQKRLMTVRDREMESFISIATHMEEDIVYLRPDEVALSEGDCVRIHGGAFDGATGTLLRIKGKRGKRVVVSIEGLAAVAAAYVTPDFIEVLSRSKDKKKAKV